MLETFNCFQALKIVVIFILRRARLGEEGGCLNCVILILISHSLEGFMMRRRRQKRLLWRLRLERPLLLMFTMGLGLQRWICLGKLRFLLRLLFCDQGTLLHTRAVFPQIQAPGLRRADVSVSLHGYFCFIYSAVCSEELIL